MGENNTHTSLKGCGVKLKISSDFVVNVLTPWYVLASKMAVFKILSWYFCKMLSIPWYRGLPTHTSFKLSPTELRVEGITGKTYITYILPVTDSVIRMLSGDDISSCDDGRGIHSSLHSSSWEYMGHHNGNHNGRRSGGDDWDKGLVEGSSKLRKNKIIRVSERYCLHMPK